YVVTQPGAPRIHIDGDGNVTTAAREPIVLSDEAACVNGSVVLTSTGIANYVDSSLRLTAIRDTDVVMSLPDGAFDGMLEQLPVLVAGGCLVLSDPGSA